MSTGSTQPAATPAGLSFPAQIFQKLSPSSYLLRHLQSESGPVRPSSRAPEDFRSPTLHKNALSNSHGSAVMRTGDTAVVCGVRGEILSLTTGEGRVKGKTVLQRNGQEQADGDLDEINNHSLIVPNLELGTGCSRDYHPGPPSDFAQATVERLRSLLIDTTAFIPASTLRIVDADGEIKAYWVLYIDIVCISLDGNVLDTAWAALVAALHSTRLPLASWDPDREVVVSDPKPAAYRALELCDIALTTSFCIFTSTERSQSDTWILSDPDEFEESVCEERVLVCVRPDGKLARIEKSGGFGAGMEVISECVRRALERFEFWENLIKSN